MVQESTQADKAVIAEGVDEEPVEANRRLFYGLRAYARRWPGLSTIYAAVPHDRR